MRDTLLKAIARAALHSPRRIVLAAVFLAVVSGIYASLFLRMNANTDDLIAADRPYMKDYRAFLDEFGDLEPIICVVAPKDPSNREQAERCVDTLIEKIAGVPGIRSVHGRIDPTEQQRLAFLAMNDEEFLDLSHAGDAINALRREISVPELLHFAGSRLKSLPRTLAPEAQLEKGAAAIFALQCLASVVPGSTSAREISALTARPRPEYLRSATGKLYFLEIMPSKDYGTLAVIAKPLQSIRTILREQRSAFPEVAMGLTGKPVLQADEMATTDEDMTRSSMIAVVLVALLFMGVMGGVKRPLLAVVALLLAIAWTFGVTTLVIGQLNLLSIVFTLILVGIGIDFGVHVVARFREERERSPLEPALTQALLSAGRGNITGATTSSVAFFMALLTDFRGLQELGFIGGTGLLLCLISMMVVLPALLVLTDPQPEQPITGRRAPLRSMPLARGKRAALTLVVIVGVTFLLLPSATGLHFNGNVLELQATGLDSIAWEHRILNDSAAASWFGAAVVDDLQEAARVTTAAEEQDSIGAILSPLEFIRLPGPKREKARQALLRQREKPATVSDRTWGSEEIRDAAKSVLRLKALAQTLDHEAAKRLDNLGRSLMRLAKTLELPKRRDMWKKRVEHRLAHVGETLNTMMSGLELPLREALPASVRHRLVAPSGRMLVSLHPRRNVWDVANMERYVRDMKKVAPQVTGVPITHLYSIHDMRRGFARAALYAFLAVLLLVFIDFKRPREALLALIPLLLGACWLALAMVFLDLDFNLANFFAVPILIGLSVDNGIHMVHRWRETPDAMKTFGSTQKGILLTSLTSLVGFGCLAFATHQGLMSLGLLMALGCTTSLLAALLVLPLTLSLLKP